MHIGVTCISLICISQVVVCQLRNSTITLFWDERAVLSGSAGEMPPLRSRLRGLTSDAAANIAPAPIPQ